MTQEKMPDVGELQRKLKEALAFKGEEKLVAMRRLLRSVEAAEGVCLRDWTIPYGVVQELRGMLPEVTGSINRLEAAKRRKEGV